MKTNSLLLTNSPALPSTNDIRGIRPPVLIPDVLLWVFIGLGILAAFAIIIFAVIYFLRKSAEPAAIRIIPPHERARQKLQDALALINEPRPFCTLVSDTVRVYLEERFNFHAPERTTEEFLHELQSTQLLLPDQKQSLGDFLSLCDMVKFARYEPGPTELEALHNSALRLIDETEPEPANPQDPIPSAAQA
ncbi:hypothetical protein [Pedosphaera parvula]|uniref:DUF4381 domain-containing protein n=1 Tax=Pedosphaera parvula (strain Ellin514) TaxID=320771 RepID=B9XFC9_PEDPL|nr:hypothetical protein [Pedosphaera parvula]EEF61293.1 hypothetical protein Cflav_PD4314 [Pedosphaera parvula Ellin514]